MRVIPKPNISPIRTYIRCFSSYRQPTKNNFRNIRSFINVQSQEYDQRAINKNLYTFPVHITVEGNITKDEMVKLYNDKMVKHPSVRRIYDKLMALPTLSRCPYCGISSVRNLDHFLPETKFPTFSVLPYNLVASCRDCNFDKSTSYAVTQNTQTLHPYYDDYTNDQWLYARILHTSPASMQFYVNTPTDWAQLDKDRVQAHFDGYDLAKRFSIEASNSLANLREEFLFHNTSSFDIQQELQKKARSHENRYKNSWETAMYQSLYQDQWYYNGGYIL